MSELCKRKSVLGEILWEDFMLPYKMSYEAAGSATGLSNLIIYSLVNDDTIRNIPKHVAQALGKGFGTSTEFWENLSKKEWP